MYTTMVPDTPNFLRLQAGERVTTLRVPGAVFPSPQEALGFARSQAGDRFDASRTSVVEVEREDPSADANENGSHEYLVRRVVW